MNKTECINRIRSIRLKAADDLCDSNISYIRNNPTLKNQKKWQELADLMEEVKKTINMLYNCNNQLSRMLDKT